MNKIICLFLAIVTLSLCFIGCGGKTPTDPADTTAESTEPVVDTTEATTDSAEDTTPQPEEKEELPIKLADLSKYEIIYPDKSPKALIESFSQVKPAIDDTFSVDITSRTDKYKKGVQGFEKGEFEILLGATNRDESAEFIASLNRDNYGFAIINGKIVIAGRTDEGTEKAIKRFISVIKKGDRSETFFDNSRDKFVHIERYPAKDVKINGISASDYTLVYPNSNGNMEKELLEYLREHIADICGAYPEIVSDKTADPSKHMLVVGNANVISAEMKAEYSSAMSKAADWKYYTAGSNGVVWINAADRRGLTAAVFDDISNRISKESTDITVETEAKTGSVSKISVMSYNIYFGNIENRKANVLQMIHNYMPDLLGVQEAAPQWMDYLRSALGSDGYEGLGEGRNGGHSGEYSAIFYNANKFKLISSETKWLSDTPDKRGSTAASGVFPRIMTYAILERKSDGLRFIYVNTHLDHTSEEVREKQIAVLIEQISMLPKLPVILTGDFNMGEGQAPYDVLVASGLADCAKEAFDTYDKSTPTCSASRIDFIFGTPLNVLFCKYEVGNKPINGEYPSDHHPIFAEAYLFTQNTKNK